MPTISVTQTIPYYMPDIEEYTTYAWKSMESQLSEKLLVLLGETPHVVTLKRETLAIYSPNNSMQLRLTAEIGDTHVTTFETQAAGFSPVMPPPAKVRVQHRLYDWLRSFIRRSFNA